MWSERGSRAIFFPACLEKRGALSVEDATYTTKKNAVFAFWWFQTISCTPDPSSYAKPGLQTKSGDGALQDDKRGQPGTKL